ncbi:hypothetical protein TTRE_0000659201 [Trichuris trichiura]|uniref:Uncharacterized protein n=1 Tax=Trichuris trichiura TaxID=36087 RepID=A0A077ZI70_TRITR|nr:hypothetical protein TTRE_0000659201 [Trichuris trichiura]
MGTLIGLGLMFTRALTEVEQKMQVNRESQTKWHSRPLPYMTQPLQLTTAVTLPLLLRAMSTSRLSSTTMTDIELAKKGCLRWLILTVMAKLEVRIKYCCCCGLNIATLLIALYSLVDEFFRAKEHTYDLFQCMYILFLGLAAWSMWRINNGIPDPQPSTVALAQVNVDSNTIILVDPYFDTLGLYTEELKYSIGVRYPVLVINMIIYLIIIISSVLLLFALCLKSPWLMIPWICSVLLDVVRGFISCVMIFVLSGGDVRKIAVGVFFLGLQLFHDSKFSLTLPCLTVDCRSTQVATAGKPNLLGRFK